MRITEAAHYLGISINTLKQMADSGKIKAYKTTGGHRRFKREALDSFMGEVSDERKGYYQKVSSRHGMRRPYKWRVRVRTR